MVDDMKEDIKQLAIDTVQKLNEIFDKHGQYHAFDGVSILNLAEEIEHIAIEDYNYMG